MSKAVLILFYPATVPENHPRFSMPYALLYLERHLRDLNIEIIIIDEDINPTYQPFIEEHSKDICCAAVSCMTGQQLKGGINFSKYIRTNYPHVKIIWGGWHPSVLPELTLKEAYIDYIIHGQGEWAFKELIQCLLAKTDPFHIKGLAYKTDNDIIVNAREPYRSTDDMPPVNYDLLDLKKYVVADTIVYFASHGCVYQCGFCAMSTMYQKKWFPKKISLIIEELKHLQNKTAFKYINFQDDNFFVNRTFTLSLCNTIIDSGLKFEFITSAHARNILTYSDEELELIYKAGCRKVYIGAESGSQKILDLINKKETVEDNFEVLKKLTKYNIITVFSTMVALPPKPEEDLKMTLNMLRKAKLIAPKLEALIFYYTPFPKTPMYELALQNGFSPPQNTEEWSAYTMFSPHIPWHKKYFKKRLEYFYNYFFPFYNKEITHIAPSELKKTTSLFLKLFWKLNRWRFHHNFFFLPFEARLMLYFVKKYNQKHKQRFCFSGTWSFFENRYF